MCGVFGSVFVLGVGVNCGSDSYILTKAVECWVVELEGDVFSEGEGWAECKVDLFCG